MEATGALHLKRFAIQNHDRTFYFALLYARAVRHVAVHCWVPFRSILDVSQAPGFGQKSTRGVGLG